ncbi:TonB family protein [bacterium]|nr:TonB family protein [bacterium]
MSAQSIAVAQSRDSFPFMLVMSIGAHVIAILFALVAPYILPERTPSEFGGPGGTGGLKVVGVIDFGKGKPGKQTTTPVTEEEPAPAKQIRKVNKEPEPEELDSKLTLPEEKPKKKDEPTAKSTLNQKERKYEGEFGTGKDTRKESGKSGTDGKGFGIKTAGPGGGTGGAFGTGGTPFPFPWYVENVLTKIESNWVKPYIVETTPQEYNCVVYFVITRAGQVRDVKIESGSGIAALDRSAESAIQSSTPFPPLPNQWLEPDLAFRANFSYTR